MGHEDEACKDGHRPRDSVRDGGKSKENRKREHSGVKHDRDEKDCSYHGEDNKRERKSEKSHNGKGRTASKEMSKQDDKYTRYTEGMEEKSRALKTGRDIANDRDRHKRRDKNVNGADDSLDAGNKSHLDEMKEDRHVNERIKDGVHERNRLEHKIKTDKYEEDSMEVLEESKSGKHLDKVKENRYVDEFLKDSAHEREKYRHRDTGRKHEEDVLDPFQESSSRKRLDRVKEKSKRSRDNNSETDLKMEIDRHRHKEDNREAETRKENAVGETVRYCSEHKVTRKEISGHGVPEKYERKEKPHKRKDYDDIPSDLLAGQRHLKRTRESFDSEKGLSDYNVKGGKGKKSSEPNFHAEFTDDLDSNLKSQSLNNGKQLVYNKSDDGNGLSSVSNPPLAPTKDVHDMLPVVAQATSSMTGSFPSVVASNVESLTTISLSLEPSEASTQEDSQIPSKTGAGRSSEGMKASSFSLDALLKAKKALQMQKELSEKLKKLPQLNKAIIQSSSALTTAAAPSPAAPLIPPTCVPFTPAVQNTLPVSVNTSVPVTRGGIGCISGVTSGMPGVLPHLGTISNYEAVKRAQEYVVRLGFQQPPGLLLGVVPSQGSSEVGTASQTKTVKAPVLRLDAHGREIDEHGNIVDHPKVSNISTLKVNINKQKKEAFQILHPELDEDPVSLPHFDPRMGINRKKLVRPKRSSFQFVEEGKWSKQAEILRLNSQFGEAKAKEIKMKQAVLAKAKAEADINPNLIEVVERIPVKEKPLKDPIPDVEWWDAALLTSGSYKDVSEGCLKIKMERLTIYIEHPVPIEPPAEPVSPPPQPLKLTKKEQKKLRTQRRLAKEKETQEMIRQGLMEPPKPKVKMSNLMKVLGAEATQDPTRLEQEIRTAAAEREQAHTDRNLARKLTPLERREKKEKKLFDDPNTLETIVSVYRVNDLSHPQVRFKVDVNAQQNRLTGAVVMCDALSVVIVEGGSKSIKRYSKLMSKRINWATVVKEDDHVEEDKPHHVNKCSLVWQGSVAKPAFDKFLIQQCRTEVAARKILADAGVAHYWDLAVNFSDE